MKTKSPVAKKTRRRPGQLDAETLLSWYEMNFRISRESYVETKSARAWEDLKLAQSRIRWMRRTLRVEFGVKK